MTLKNLMRHLTTRLEDGYCSITVANHLLITIIRFVAKSYTHPWIFFANRLHLVHHTSEIPFSRNMHARILTWSNKSNNKSLRHVLFQLWLGSKATTNKGWSKKKRTCPPPLQLTVLLLSWCNVVIKSCPCKVVSPHVPTHFPSCLLSTLDF